MRDDDPEDKERDSVPTIPPPAGESDIYEAKTQIGGLTPEALAMLRQLRDEKPMTGLDLEANVPVFEDDAESTRTPLVRPAAGSPVAPAAGKPALAPTPPAPAAGRPAVAATPAPSAAKPAAVIAPAAARPATVPVAAPSKPAPVPPAMTSSPSLDPPVAAVFATAKPGPVAPVAAVAAVVVASVEVGSQETYESVFAPLPPSTATPDVASPDTARRAGATTSAATWPLWVIVGLAGMVFVALAVVLMGKAGWLPGLGPVAPH